MLAWLLIVVLLVGGLVLMLQGDAGTIAGFEPATFAGLVAGGCLLVYFATSFVGSYRGRGAQILRDMAAWIAIALALAVGYSFREELSMVGRRLAGELLPPGSSLTVDSTSAGERAVRLRSRPSGHFVARVEVDGASVMMLVDTGASTIVLTASDASRAGIDTRTLSYTVEVQTANGKAFAAPVRLRRVAVGPVELESVDALVAKSDALKESLLGMSFLGRLRSYEFSGEYLTLRS